MIRNRVRTAMAAVVPSGDLATRTARSGVWLTVSNVSQRALELVALLVLARLLSPTAFGLIGIALLVLTGLERFSQLGFTTALIQRHEDDVDRYLDTAWTLQILRGILLAAIVFALAGPAATFFGTPQVEPILQVIAIVPILVGLENPGVIYFQKDLEFHKQFLHLSSTTLVYVTVTIALALTWGNVWALVAGKLAAETSNLVVSYLLHDYRPRPGFDAGAARELLNFGKWIFASSIVYFLNDEGSDFVVGWLLGAASLGFYRLSYRLALTPASEVSGVISTVMFPAYSKLQGDVRAVREAFFRTVQLVTAVTFPTGVGIIVVAPLFVEGVLGPQWVPMIGVFQLLSVYGLLISLSGSFGPVWLAMGHPDYSAKIGAARVVVLAVLIYPAMTTYGLVGAAGAILAAFAFVALPIDLYVSRKLMDMRLRDFFGVVSYPAAAAAVMGVSVWFVRETVVIESVLLELAGLIALGVVVYVAVALVLVRVAGWGIVENLRGVGSALGG
jgi:PST family polysaccharide transporter/lipopolysaccharide exporter